MHIEHHRLFRREFDTPEAMTFHRIHELQAARRLLCRLLNTSDHEEEFRFGLLASRLSNHELASLFLPVGHWLIKGSTGDHIEDVTRLYKALSEWLVGLLLWVGRETRHHTCWAQEAVDDFGASRGEAIVAE